MCLSEPMERSLKHAHEVRQQHRFRLRGANSALHCCRVFLHLSKEEIGKEQFCSASLDTKDCTGDRTTTLLQHTCVPRTALYYSLSCVLLRGQDKSRSWLLRPHCVETRGVVNKNVGSIFSRSSPGQTYFSRIGTLCEMLLSIMCCSRLLLKPCPNVPLISDY